MEEIDNKVPIGEQRHRALLRRMELEVANVRPLVLRSETLEALEPYLGFRHFFRHSYTFEIDWQKLEALARNIDIVLQVFRSDVESFFDKFLMELEACLCFHHGNPAHRICPEFLEMHSDDD